VFFQKDSGMRPSDPPWSMRLAMILFSGICIGLGVFPEFLYSMLPYEVTYEPYTVTHVIHMLQLLLFSGFAFFLMLPLMKRTLTITLDADWIYRRAAPIALQHVFSVIWQIDKTIRDAFMLKLNACLSYFSGKGGRLSVLLSKNYPTGSMAMWVAVVLASYLLLSFIP
jgi:multicomponent Na+:H+ antiporter subunit D